MAVFVKNILEAKGRDVVSVDPDRTLLEVAEILNGKKIGAVVITGAESRITGIFTERDLVRAIATKGMDVLSAPVKEMMTKTVRRCKEDTTVDQLMDMMSTGRFRHVPVEMNGKLCRIVSIGDVVKSRIREIELEAEHIKAYIAG